ncbi:MAG: cytochrome P450 [Gammaproteobacteria bacterium]
MDAGIVDLTAPVMFDDPWATFRRLRATTPVAPCHTRQSRSGTVILTRYDDVTAFYKDARFSSDATRNARLPLLNRFMPRVYRLLYDSIVFKDDPEHRRIRSLVDRTFTPARVAALADQIARVTHELLAGMERQAARGETVDLVRAFALPLPLTVICELLGVPEHERERFQEWVNQLIDSTDGSLWKLLRAVPTAHRIMRLFERLVEMKRAEPDDRLISALVRLGDDPGGLTRQEVLAMTFLMLLAGHETTTSLIGSGTLALIEHPDQLRRLLADPALIDPAVEELLRFTSPVTMGAPRIALEDVEIGASVIRRGTPVLGMINSANRDERVFADPDALDIGRTPNRHIAFGTGVHMCLGLWLARAEAKIALDALVRRFPRMQLAVPRRALRWKAVESLRGLRQLPLILEPR